MKSSVCICSYNGEKFIQEQLNSILNQIGKKDEVIIIDDCSTDKTVRLIEQYKDMRINLIINKKNLGPIKTFEKAIKFSKNEIIFLSDQDDIWIEGRFELMKNKLLNSDAFLLSSNSIFIDKYNEPIKFEIDGVFEKDSKNYKKNIIDIFVGKTNYYSCLMAFKRDFINLILPIPTYVESNCLWFAMCANLTNKNLHIEAVTLKRRIHENNFSLKPRKLILKIFSRIKLLIQIFEILKRLKSIKKPMK